MKGKYGVEYGNGGGFYVTKLRKRSIKHYPKCDTVALRIVAIENNKKVNYTFALTLDEMACIGMLCNELVWELMPRAKRK